MTAEEFADRLADAATAIRENQRRNLARLGMTPKQADEFLDGLNGSLAGDLEERERGILFDVNRRRGRFGAAWADVLGIVRRSQ